MNRKIILFLVVALATSSAALVDNPPLPVTEELFWDNGTYHHSLYEFDRGVWFTMPFDAQVVTARVYIVPATEAICPTTAIPTVPTNAELSRWRGNRRGLA